MTVDYSDLIKFGFHQIDYALRNKCYIKSDLSEITGASDYRWPFQRVQDYFDFNILVCNFLSLSRTYCKTVEVSILNEPSRVREISFEGCLLDFKYINSIVSIFKSRLSLKHTMTFNFRKAQAGEGVSFRLDELGQRAKDITDFECNFKRFLSFKDLVLNNTFVEEGGFLFSLEEMPLISSGGAIFQSYYVSMNRELKTLNKVVSIANCCVDLESSLIDTTKLLSPWKQENSFESSLMNVSLLKEKFKKLKRDLGKEVQDIPILNSIREKLISFSSWDAISEKTPLEALVKIFLEKREAGVVFVEDVLVARKLVDKVNERCREILEAPNYSCFFVTSKISQLKLSYELYSFARQVEEGEITLDSKVKKEFFRLVSCLKNLMAIIKKFSFYREKFTLDTPKVSSFKKLLSLENPNIHEVCKDFLSLIKVFRGIPKGVSCYKYVKYDSFKGSLEKTFPSAESLEKVGHFRSYKIVLEFPTKNNPGRKLTIRKEDLLQK
jgi:hypothetical protein